MRTPEPAVLWSRKTKSCAYPFYLDSCGKVARRTHSLSWRWAAAGCEQSPSFSIPRMCALMRGGDVHFLGDSMSGEHAQTLATALNGCKSHRRWSPATIRCPAGTPSFRVLFSRVDHLAPGDRAVGAVVQDARPGSVIVLNRGSHFSPDAELLPAVLGVVRELATARPDLLLVWRTTPAGHAGCATHSAQGGAPLTVRPDEAGLPHHWGEFARQNEGVVAALAAQHPAVLVLDVVPMTALRRDSHTARAENGKEDCLHYCQPGPVDGWVEGLVRVLWAERG